jgi:dihydropteridine reductase
MFDAIYCTAGGFSMGSAEGDPVSFLDAASAMMSKNVHSSLLAVGVAMQHLKPDGLLVLTGSSGALEPTPAMVQYGMAKSAVHHLARSVKKLPGKAIAVLPTTLDTPANRTSMPKADKKLWIPLPDLANLLDSWGRDASKLVRGGLYVVEMVDGAGGSATLNTRLVS